MIPANKGLRRMPATQVSSPLSTQRRRHRRCVAHRRLPTGGSCGSITGRGGMIERAGGHSRSSLHFERPGSGPPSRREALGVGARFCSAKRIRASSSVPAADLEQPTRWRKMAQRGPGPCALTPTRLRCRRRAAFDRCRSAAAASGPLPRLSVARAGAGGELDVHEEGRKVLKKTSSGISTSSARTAAPSVSVAHRLAEEVRELQRDGVPEGGDE